MSDNKKKALLNEATTRRFWKLAGLRPLQEKAYVFEDEEELEEMRYADEDEEPIDDMGDEEAIDDMGADEAPVDDLGDEEAPVGDLDDDLGAEDGEMADVEVDVPEGDVASLRTARDVLDQILSAVDGDEPEAEEDMEMEPEPDGEPAMDEEEPLDLGPEELEEAVERIATRVAARIQEALKK